jgi:hypothetical protein
MMFRLLSSCSHLLQDERLVLHVVPGVVARSDRSMGQNISLAPQSILKLSIMPFDQHHSHGSAVLRSFHPSTHHKHCNRVPNWSSLKTGLKKGGWSDRILEVPKFQEVSAKGGALITKTFREHAAAIEEAERLAFKSGRTSPEVRSSHRDRPEL